MTAPRLLISGPRGTARQVLAERVAAEFGVPVLDSGLLRQQHPGDDDDQVRWATLHVVQRLAEPEQPVVALDDGALFRLPAGHDAFAVELNEIMTIRRQRMVWNGHAQDRRAGQDLRLEDARQAIALRRAFAIDTKAATGRHWQADLVLGCPERHTCPDLAQCQMIQARLLDTALAAYQAHLAEVPVTQAGAAFAAFAEAREAHPEHVHRCSPALAGPDRGVSMTRWRRRVWELLDPIDIVEDRSYA